MKTSSSEGMLTPVVPSITRKPEPSVKPIMVSVPSITFNRPTIIETLVEENKPVFVAEKLPGPKEAIIFNDPFTSRTDEVMEKLLNHGYVIEHRLYEGQFISQLVAKTRAGDMVLIKVDSAQYRASFPKIPASDILLERKSAVTLVPQETKWGILQCLNNNVCGAAFICSNSLCVTEKKVGKEVSFTEENFVFRSSPNLSGGKIGRHLVAYPIIPLTKILEAPLAMEDQIASQTKLICELGFDRLDEHQKKLKEAIDHFQTQANNLGLLNQEAKTRLCSDIDQCAKLYEKIREVNPESLPEDLKTDYYMIIRILTEKKAAREKYLNGMANAYAITNMIKSLSDEFKGMVDPVLNTYMEAL